MTILAVGQIWSCQAYCPDEHGKPKTKYLLILGFDNGELVCRTLTSRSHGRPVDPACFHGYPYPSFYIGVLQLGGYLNKDSWLDLRENEDYPESEFKKKISAGKISYVMTLQHPGICELLNCAAYADDTTKRQKKSILCSRESAGC